VPSHVGTLAPPGELVLLSAHLSPQPKRQIDRFSRFCTAHSRKCLYFAMGNPFLPKLPLSMVESGPPPIISWTHLSQQPKHLVRFSHFAQMTAGCPYTLEWDAPFPLKIAPSHGGLEPPSNAWFPGSTQVLNPNGISIGSAVFAGLTTATDKQTDKPRYLVGKNRLQT